MFLCSRTKKAFKPLSQATFAIAKFQYLFRISQFSHFFFKVCQVVICPVKGYITMYDARPESVKAFFILEQRNIHTWLYVPLTENIKTHQTYFREK